MMPNGRRGQAKACRYARWAGIHCLQGAIGFKVRLGKVDLTLGRRRMNPLHWKREYQVAWKHRGVERQSDKDGSKKRPLPILGWICEPGEEPHLSA